MTDLHPFDTRTILSWLSGQHRRILGIVAGLDDEALRRPVLPSGWSCVELLQHLTMGARFWCRKVMCGAVTEPFPDDDFAVPHTVPTAAVVEAFEHEVEASLAAVAGLPLDTPPAAWPEGLFGDWRLEDLGEVLLHLLVETACHAGHLDAVRELLDGRTWDYEHGRLSAASS